jgi:hypothetical protein
LQEPTVTPSEPPVEGDLFPDGRPTSETQIALVLEQCKLILDTTESIESRRQTLHTFFMSINSLFLAAIGLLGKESLDTPGVGVGVILLGATGALLSVSWGQQVRSHGHVTASKWEVINQIEAALPSRPFCAEWRALQRRGYRSFTAVESSIPVTFTALYAISVVVGALLVADLI